MKNPLRSFHWINIASKVTEIALPILPHIRSRKLRSEIISSLFESKAAEYFNSISIPVFACASDREPDLIFAKTHTPLEIKVTGIDTVTAKKFSWMGGKYSKRTSDHVFIAYSYVQPTIFDTAPSIRYFIAKCFVSKTDWKSREKGGENFYGTLFTTDDMLARKHEILVGNHTMGIFSCE